MDVGLFGRDESDQQRYAAQKPRLLLDRIAVVAQMLQIGGRVGLHHRVRVVEECDDFVQIRIAPSYTFLLKQQNLKSPSIIRHHSIRSHFERMGLCGFPPCQSQDFSFSKRSNKKQKGRQAIQKQTNKRTDHFYRVRY